MSFRANCLARPLAFASTLRKYMMTHALIIDDDRVDLGVLKELLAMEQITYTALNDSTKVQAVLEQGASIDVVLLDLGMPILNGYQVFDLIRQYPHMAQVPV